MARKRKNNNIDIACQYKHFNSSKKNGSKQQTHQTKRNKKMRYFEHDTRTAGVGGGADGGRCGGGGVGGVKKIKFNNEISIYETNESRTISSAAVNVSVKKRTRTKSTKQLQKQLIDTQKRLQRQLIKLQQHQHNSFLALLCATECNNPNQLNCQPNNHNQCTSNINNKNQMMVNACSHFTTNHSNHNYCNNYDTSSLSNKIFTTEKMANGINRSFIPCETLHSDVEFSSKLRTKSLPDSSCTSCAAHAHCKPHQSSAKSNKPAIKSIILSASSQTVDATPFTTLNIKQEPVDDENAMSHINVPNKLKRIEKHCKQTVNSGYVRKEVQAANSNFTPPRDSSQLKSKEMLGKSASVTTDYRLSSRDGKMKSRQKSPPNRRHSSRRKSKSADRSTRSRSSDTDHYSRQSSSRESTPRRSRSRRSLSRRSESRSRSRSRRSRDTRSYGSTTSTSSSDSDRRSNSRQRDQRGTGDSKRNYDYHESNSRGNQYQHRSKSPIATDRKSFNYNNSIMSTSKRNSVRTEKSSLMPSKHFAYAPFAGNHGPETSKKHSMKPQPIVKLHSEPGTDSDGEEKFEREYEELLTFETNEDERREQRLLKALSDIAAKAKQKIQSITNETSMVTVPTMVTNMQQEGEGTRLTYAKPNRNNVRTASNDKSNDRRSTSYHNDDYSPKSKTAVRRSRKDDDGTNKSWKTLRSSRSPSIPRRRGSPSFLDRRRITSARKKPIPYQRSTSGKSDDEWNSSDKD